MLSAASEESATSSGCPRGVGDFGESIRQIVRTQFPALRSCYVSEIDGNAALTGRVTLAFDLSPGGEPLNVRFEPAAIASPAVQRCVLRVLRGVHFAPPPDGMATVRYPLVFTQSD